MAFTLSLTSSAYAVVEKIKNAVLSNNGEFNGDENSGSIKINTPLGAVAGNYSIDGNQIMIDITKKPLFLNEAMIKNELERYLQPQV